jgi:hypothetical protein
LDFCAGSAVGRACPAAVCAENTREDYANKNTQAPETDKPDF